MQTLSLIFYSFWNKKSFNSFELKNLSYLLGQTAPANHCQQSQHAEHHHDTGLRNGQAVQPVHLVVQLGDLALRIDGAVKAVASQHDDKNHQHCNRQTQSDKLCPLIRIHLCFLKRLGKRKKLFFSD